jgi:2',3'-cyclic-nucleotide 2'-phosphodiesterase (5'-nucleotidase family)
MHNNLKILILSFAFFSTHAVFADSPQQDITLIYSGNLNGELEPCGCAEETDLGGIKRRATIIQSLRKKKPELVLITSGGLLSSESPRDRLKGEYILKGISMLKYDAVAIQWRDLAYGAEFINKTTLPLVSSNWHDDTFAKKQLIQRGKLSLAFFNWLDPKKAPQRQMQGKHQVVDNNKEALLNSLAQAKKDHAITILSTTLSLKKARKRFSFDNIDILLLRSAHEVYGEPEMSGSTLVLQPGSRGMRLGRVDFSIDTNNKISTYQHEVIRLPDSVPDAANYADWYIEYNAKVKENYLKHVETRKKLETGESPFAGEEVCKTCHAAQHKIWQDSKHAQAYEELEAVNKAFDPDCIVCHTVGFEKTGGFIDATVTANLINVQCESCHGAGREHATSGGAKPVANHQWPNEKMCAQCHVGSHSPSFKFETYWPKIVHTHKP